MSSSSKKRHKALVLDAEDFCARGNDVSSLVWLLRVGACKVRQSLLESLCENKHTKLIALEFQKLKTVEFCNAVKARVKDMSVQSLNYHNNILNMPVKRKRMKFADRIIAQFLVVLISVGRFLKPGVSSDC
jgi:hypothetical protein